MEIPKKGDIWTYSCPSYEATFIIADDPVYQKITWITSYDNTDYGYGYVFMAYRIANPRGYCCGKEYFSRTIADFQREYWKKVA